MGTSSPRDRSGTVRSALVLANLDKPAARELVSELEPWLRERVQTLEVRGDVRAFCAEREGAAAAGRALPRPDLVVVLGGDGAILGTVRAFGRDPVPTLGINLGRVGFLASTPAADWREALESCLAGRALTEPRMRLEAEWGPEERPERALALNEVTLQRSSHQGMIRAALWVGSDWVTNYRADGVIVATPSGSTAYSLSAGGPILEPTIDALVVTPICPQGLSNRPLVLPASAVLTLEVLSAGRATLAVDGHSYHTLSHGQTMRVRRHPVPYPLLWPRGVDPYRRLRERLGWRGSLDAERPPAPGEQAD